MSSPWLYPLTVRSLRETQGASQRAADYFAPIEATPVHRLDTPEVSGVYDENAKRRSRQGLDVRISSDNPTGGIIQKRQPKAAGYANRPRTAGKIKTCWMP